VKPSVALVAHGIHDHGGMERACAELLRHAHDDYDFTVVSAELAPELRPLVRRWIRVRVPMRPIPLKFVLFWLRAGWLVKRADVDLVHTVGAIIPNRVDMASIHFCHAGFLRSVGHLAPPSNPPIRKLNTTVAHLLALAAERWSYRLTRLRLLAAVSAGVRDELLAHYPGVDVRITPNGVSIDRFRPDASIRAELRSEIGLAEQPVAVFAGGDWDRKGLCIAIRSLADVRAKGVDLRLWVLGAGDEDRFSAMARRLGVASAVSFFGPRHDLERFFAAGDVFVLPSLYETFSLVGFEAAASGLPVVVTPVHGIGDLVKENGVGIVAERGVASFTEALLRLTLDADLRHRLGQKALKASQNYSWRASVATVIDLYESLLSRQPQSATDKYG
jgi:glycosyltransferase involved in cell wall biosynthesis